MAVMQENPPFSRDDMLPSHRAHTASGYAHTFVSGPKHNGRKWRGGKKRSLCGRV